MPKAFGVDNQIETLLHTSWRKKARTAQQLFRAKIPREIHGDGARSVAGCSLLAEHGVAIMELVACCRHNRKSGPVRDMMLLGATTVMST